MLVLLDEAGCPVACTAHPWDRLLAHLRAFRLDSDLAAGASPEASVALALRAQMLVRTRHRYELARSADRVLAAATQPTFSGRPRVPVCRDRVRDCSEELGELIRRLRTTGPVPAQGVAKVGVLLADASGPLYHRASADDLRARLRDAADALVAA
jgi:hypothetical protein